MSGMIHALIEQYGLIAVFAGCFFEGETAAILGGFFAHQGVFRPWTAFAVIAVGAFSGDLLFFALGRLFAEHKFVLRLREKPGFSHALQLVQSHPNLFVLSNRYLYGLRIAGGIAVGLSTVPIPRFLFLNAVSAMIWAALFGGLGYFFGLGVEAMLGAALHRHYRLLIALGIGVVALVAAVVVTRHYTKKRASRDAKGAWKTEPPRE